VRVVAAIVGLTNEQPITAWDVSESAHKPLARFGSASVRKPVSEGIAKANAGDALRAPLSKELA
jgi:hypothetical protein